MTVTTEQPVRLGAEFETVVGRKLSELRTPADLEAAMEQKLGRKLVAVKNDPDALRKRAQKLIEESRILLANF
jgi:hypothetical protein